MKKNMLCHFLKSIMKHSNLYILGAGASSGIIPTTLELEQQIIKYWLRMDSYSTGTNEKKSDTYSRVIKGWPFNDLKRASLNNHVLEWLIPFFISSDTEHFRKHPKQYSIFNFLPASFVVSFNLDRLALISKRKHVVIEPHGSVPIGLKRKLSPYIYDFLEYEIECPYTKNCLLIRPEEENILKRPEYVLLQKQWKHFKDILLIGYSFSKFLNTVDDYYSLEFFTEMIKYHKNSVFLIDPFPDYTQFLIEERIKAKINVLSVKWNVLCKTLTHYLQHVNIYSLHTYVHEIDDSYKLLLSSES